MAAIVLPTTDILPSPGGASITYTDQSGALRIITFDCTVRVLHNGTAVVTEKPVDEGANISDHIRAENRRVTLEVEVTNTPVLSPTGKGGLPSAVQLQRPRVDFTKLAKVTGGQHARRVGPISFTSGSPPVVSPAETSTVIENVSATVLQFAESFDRVLEVSDALDELRTAGTPVGVTTRLRQYTRCAIVSVSAPEEAADSITFSIDLVETRLVSSETIDVQPPVKEQRAKKKTTGGTGAGYEIPASTQTGILAGLDALPPSAKKYLKGF